MVAPAVEGIDLCCGPLHFRMDLQLQDECNFPSEAAIPGAGKTMSIRDKRKTTTSHTAERWAMRETIWKVVGGENK
jgi:hypothetical protein